MNINRKKQSQFELFPGVSKASSCENARSARLTKDLTLSLENIIVLCIIFVMVVVLFFSFGVEKGKKVAIRSIQVGHGITVQDHGERLERTAVDAGGRKLQNEQVILPVDASKEAISESQPVDHPAIELMDEQENLFTIQVASFKLKKNAQREVQRLKGVGHEDIFVIAKGNYSIVCVGKFSRKVEAKRYSSRLKGRYKDFLVRRL